MLYNILLAAWWNTIYLEWIKTGILIVVTLFCWLIFTSKNHLYFPESYSVSRNCNVCGMEVIWWLGMSMFHMKAAFVNTILLSKVYCFHTYYCCKPQSFELIMFWYNSHTTDRSKLLPCTHYYLTITVPWALGLGMGWTPFANGPNAGVLNLSLWYPRVGCALKSASF